MKLTILILLTLPVISFAKPNIKILSFVMNDSRSTTNTTAEICGQITDDNSRVNRHKKVIITSDPGRNPGIYVAHTTPKGFFCHVIRTNTRRARVDAFHIKRERERTSTNVFGLTE